MLLKADFWRLLDALIGEEDSTSQGRKRSLAPVAFPKPVVPIFTKTLAALTSSSSADEDVLAGIKRGLVTVSRRPEVLGRTPAKYLEEYLSALEGVVVRPLVSEALGVFLVWVEQQENKRKVYEDLGTTLLRILPGVPDAPLQERLLLSSVFGEEIVKEIFEELQHGPGRRLHALGNHPSLKTVYFKCFITAVGETLQHKDARFAIALLFRLFIQDEESLETCAELVNILAAATISSSQSDQAWTICQTVLAALSSREGFLTPAIIEGILQVDVSILVPHKLAAILSVYRNTSPWNAAMACLARKMLEARQFDVLVAASLANTAINCVPLIGTLDPVVASLNPIQVEYILKEILLASTPGRDTVRSIVLQWLVVLTRTHLSLLLLKAFPSLLSLFASQPREARQCLEVLVERCDDERALARIAELIAPHAAEDGEGWAGIRLMLAIKGVGDLPEAIKDLSSDLALRMLPVLLKHNFAVSLRTLPSWVFDCALFWESVAQSQQQLEQLFYENAVNAKLLSTILTRKPAPLKLSSACTMFCLDAVLDGVLEREELVRCVHVLLRHCANVEDIQLTEPVMEKIVRINDPALLQWLGQARMLDRDRVFALCTLVPASVHEYVEAIEEIFDALSPDQIRVLKDAVKPCIKGGASQPSLAKYLALLLVKCSDDDEFGTDVRNGLDDSLRWQVTVALHDRDCGHLSSVDIEHAARRFLAGDVAVTARDIGRFVKGCADLTMIQRTADLIVNGDERSLRLLDVLLLQRLEVQAMACPRFDRLLLSESAAGLGQTPLLDLWRRTLQHRLACGGLNIGALQDQPVFEAVLSLIAQLLVSPRTTAVARTEVIGILSALLQYHWIPLLRRRPLFISFLVHLIRTVRGDEVSLLARLLTDLAGHRQSDQHYYIPPLILAYTQLKDGKDRRALRAAMCLLLRLMDQARARNPEDPREKYFDADPFERLMCQAEGDDAKIILKDLIALYCKEFRYTGKA